MNNKLAFGFGLLLGMLGTYAWAITKMLSAQEKITELSKPPRKITKQDWGKITNRTRLMNIKLRKRERTG